MTTATTEETTKVNAELIKIDMKKPVANGSNVQALLEQYKKAFEVAAPQHLDVNRVMRVAIMSVSRNRELLECTASSLLGAFMLAVQLGLDIGAKEAHLVPFKNKHSKQKEVQLIPDYRGVAKLARNSGLVINTHAHVVYKQDYFEYEEGLTPKLIHRPNFQHEMLDKDIIGAYNVAVFKEGYVEGHFVPRKKLDKIKNMSKATGSDSPWTQHFDEMCKKTVLKHHAKTLPQSVELATAIALDNRAELAKPQEINLLHEGDSNKLLAEMPVDESDLNDSTDQSDLTDKQPAETKLDAVVDAEKKKKAAADAPADPEKADRSDFDQLEILGTECRVFPKQWRKHIEQTMGISSWDLLPKNRLDEVRKWIEANKKS